MSGERRLDDSLLSEKLEELIDLIRLESIFIDAERAEPLDQFWDRARNWRSGNRSRRSRGCLLGRRELGHLAQTSHATITFDHPG